MLALFTSGFYSFLGETKSKPCKPKLKIEFKIPDDRYASGIHVYAGSAWLFKRGTSNKI